MMIENVRSAFEVKKQTSRIEEAEIVILIEDLLKDDACFLKIDISLALKMLLFIGYSKEEAKEVYIHLVSEGRQLLKGKYQLIDPR